MSHQICINDQIIEVDGRSLYGYTNHQAVEVLRNTGKIVKLRLARYLRGSKYEQLQQAIASADVPVPPYQQPVQQLSVQRGTTVIQVLDQTSNTSANTISQQQLELSKVNKEPISKILGEATTNGTSNIVKAQSLEHLLVEKWSQVLGLDYDIIVSLRIIFLFPF